MEDTYAPTHDRSGNEDMILEPPTNVTKGKFTCNSYNMDTRDFPDIYAQA